MSVYSVVFRFSGQPKGVLLTHGNLMGCLPGMREVSPKWLCTDRAKDRVTLTLLELWFPSSPFPVALSHCLFAVVLFLALFRSALFPLLMTPPSPIFLLRIFSVSSLRSERNVEEGKRTEGEGETQKRQEHTPTPEGNLRHGKKMNPQGWETDILVGVPLSPPCFSSRPALVIYFPLCAPSSPCSLFASFFHWWVWSCLFFLDLFDDTWNPHRVLSR